MQHEGPESLYELLPLLHLLHLGHLLVGRRGRAVVWIWKRVLWTGGGGCSDRHVVRRLDVHILLKGSESGVAA